MKQYSMNSVFLLLLILSSSLANGQETVQPSDSLVLSGNIKKQLIFTQKELDTFPLVSIKDVMITNHLGIEKGLAKNMKGFLLKKLLLNAELISPGPKVLSEFYFVLTATDQYKAVFSWNELFNSPVGDSVFVVMEKDGRQLKNSNDRILVICTSDFTTGRRYVKGLMQIDIRRVK